MGKTDEIISIVIFNIFFIAFIVAIIIFIIQYRNKKKQHTEMLQIQKEEHQKELLAAEIEIQSQTMQHIGREIHDNVGQKLTLASLYIQQLLYENQLPEIEDKIGNINQLIDTSLGDLRSLSKNLTDNSVKEQKLEELIAAECQKINALQLCTVDFQNRLKRNVNYEVKAIVLRIVQEFIQNSIKHAQCSIIHISLSSNPSNIVLKLTDNGKGFDTSKKSGGIGLANMEKRTKILHGEFELKSEPQLGTELTVTIPYL